MSWYHKIYFLPICWLSSIFSFWTASHVVDMNIILLFLLLFPTCIMIYETVINVTIAQCDLFLKLRISYVVKRWYSEFAVNILLYPMVKYLHYVLQFKDVFHIFWENYSFINSLPIFQFSFWAITLKALKKTLNELNYRNLDYIWNFLKRWNQAIVKCFFSIYDVFTCV